MRPLNDFVRHVCTTSLRQDYRDQEMTCKWYGTRRQLQRVDTVTGGVSKSELLGANLVVFCVGSVHSFNPPKRMLWGSCPRLYSLTLF